jgi:uncharacterized protein with GYD domain
MALYMVQGSYTAEALATMAKNPQDRSIPARELLQKLGGRLIDLYFCYGEYDSATPVYLLRYRKHGACCDVSPDAHTGQRSDSAPVSNLLFRS